MPTLELRVACGEGFRGRWVPVVGVGGVAGGGEVFDAVVVGALVAFCYEADVGGRGDAVDDCSLVFVYISVLLTFM